MQEDSGPKQSFLVPRDPSIDRRDRPRPEKKHKINFNLISEEEDESSVTTDGSEVSETFCLLTNETNDSLVEGALVYLRLRPVKNDVIGSSYTIMDNVLMTTQKENMKIAEKHFKFTDIFDSSIEQKDIYEKCIQHKINYEDSFSIMTYGTSGSGKTFTLLGDLESPGLLPRALEHIFLKYNNNISEKPAVCIENGIITFATDENIKLASLKSKKMLRNCNDVKQMHERVKDTIAIENEFNNNFDENLTVFIWISFVEIYNESVYDLLAADDQANQKRKPLRIVSSDGKVFLKNLNKIFVTNALEAYKLLTFGLKRNTYASTAINSNSSRSHCIFFIDVITFNQEQEIAFKSYKFCDLAGSERLAKTGNIGDRLKEAQRINTSLMVLSRCLDAASNNQNKKTQELIPFRESKLTMLLQASLLGKEKLIMIVNITPTEKYFEENLYVLGFSSIAKNMFYKMEIEKPKKERFSWFAATFNKDLRNDEKYAELIEENIFLRDEVSRLTVLLDEMEKDIRKELVDQFENDLAKRKLRYDKHIAIIESKCEAKLKYLKEYYEKKLRERDEDEDEDEENDENITNVKIDLTNEPDHMETKRRRLSESL